MLRIFTLCLFLLVGCADPTSATNSAHIEYGQKAPVLKYCPDTDSVQIGNYFITGQTMREFLYAEVQICNANSVDHLIGKQVCVYAYFAPKHQPVNNTIVQGGAGGGFISGGGDATANMPDSNIRLCVYYSPYEVYAIVKEVIGANVKIVRLEQHVIYAHRVQEFLCKAYTMATRREEL